MAISLIHPFVSGKADGGDATRVRPSNWNAEHAFTCATAKLLGRATAGTGAVEEIDCTAAGRALLDDAAASDQRTTLGLGALAVLNTVAAGQIDSNAVTTAKILDSNVTTAKIADSNVTTAKIADANVTFAKLATGAVATEAEMEAETSSKLVSADLAKKGPWAIQARGKFTGSTGGILSSYNVASVVRDSQGDYTVTFTTAFANAHYSIGIEVLENDTTLEFFKNVRTQSTTGFTIKIKEVTGADIDPDAVYFMCSGEQ